MTTDSKAADATVAQYEAMYEAVPEAARRFAADTWGETWAHAEMGSLMDFAALASTAGAGAGDWRPITTMPDDLDRKAWPIQIWAPNHVRPVSAVDWREDATDRGAAMWKPMSAPPGQSPAVPASPRSGAGEGGKVRSRLEAEGWSQASVVSGYWDKSRPDNAFVCVVNRDLRLLDEATHKLASPPAPAEHGVEIREALSRFQQAIDDFDREAADAHDMGERPDLWEQTAEVPIDDLRAVIAALSQGGGAGRSGKGEGGDEGRRAIRFAMGLEDHWDRFEFLNAFIGGDLSEWPEFTKPEPAPAQSPSTSDREG